MSDYKISKSIMNTTCGNCGTELLTVFFEDNTSGTICQICDRIRGSIIKWGDYENH